MYWQLSIILCLSPNLISTLMYTLLGNACCIKAKQTLPQLRVHYSMLMKTFELWCTVTPNNETNSPILSTTKHTWRVYFLQNPVTRLSITTLEFEAWLIPPTRTILSTSRQLAQPNLFVCMYDERTKQMIKQNTYPFHLHCSLWYHNIFILTLGASLTLSLTLIVSYFHWEFMLYFDYLVHSMSVCVCDNHDSLYILNIERME